MVRAVANLWLGSRLVAGEPSGRGCWFVRAGVKDLSFRPGNGPHISPVARLLLGLRGFREPE